MSSDDSIARKDPDLDATDVADTDGGRTGQSQEESKLEADSLRPTLEDALAQGEVSESLLMRLVLWRFAEADNESAKRAVALKYLPKAHDAFFKANPMTQVMLFRTGGAFLLRNGEIHFTWLFMRNWI